VVNLRIGKFCPLNDLPFAMDTTRPRPLRQFSLRTLLGLTLLAGLLLSFWVALVQPYRSEAKIIARLREDGAVVTTRAHGPAWWAKIAGDDFVQRIVQIEADGSKTDDADLALLADLNQLRFLMLGERCQISDSGLGGLQGAENLVDIMIANPAITDDGLRKLGRLKQLDHLYVESPFTDEGVKELGGLANLQVLGLASPHLTDAALPSLAPLSEIRELRLYGRFTDAGMPALQSLTKLESLSCTGDPARAAVAKRLYRVVDMEFMECPLSDAADFLSAAHEIPFTIDKAELQQANRDTGMPITGNVQDVVLRSGLDQLMAPHGLGWKIGDGAIVITTKEAADRSRANTLELQKRLPNLKEIDVEW
jgi:hypothetical protein